VIGPRASAIGYHRFIAIRQQAESGRRLKAES